MFRVLKRPPSSRNRLRRWIRGSDKYGDREKPGAEEGDDVILAYYGPAKRSCRNLPAPHPAPPDQPAYMAASARAQRQQHRHVARPRRGEQLGFTSREPSETKELKAEGKGSPRANSDAIQGRWTSFWFCGRALSRHNWHYGPCPFHARKGMLHRFIFAVFSKGPAATNRENHEGEGNEGSLRLLALQPLLAGSSRALPFPS